MAVIVTACIVYIDLLCQYLMPNLMKDVFYCNHDDTPDTHPVDNTQEVFEISSTSNVTQNGVHKVTISSLQFSCTNCR